ncbi:MAG TPA: SRPBCC family protein [Gemmatimonadaceae bacterium]|nr:SRPBCC family protein [Gemmatimonadaceae bacterium]
MTAADTPLRAPFKLGAMPVGRAMITLDEAIVRTDPRTIFSIAREVEHWPAHLDHYRFVRFRSRNSDGGGVVEMSANRPFGPLNWPTWWLSQMAVDDAQPAIRFRHIEGVTTGMDVEWSFTTHAEGTRVRVIHAWNGPDIPGIGGPVAVGIIGPVFIRGIASRTVAGLKAVAERSTP